MWGVFSADPSESLLHFLGVIITTILYVASVIRC